jgi:hypothetical protein
MTMTTSLEMFDRDGLVRVIDRDCLGESGTSAAVVGAHKVGKTHLLKHIASRPHRSQESFYCNIDLYLLRASLEDGESLSDHVFLRFFLSRLYEQIDEWIESQSDAKKRWDADITKAEQDLAALQKVEVANQAFESLRAQMREAVAALNQRLRQLTALAKVRDEIEELLTRRDLLKIHKVVYVFNHLQRLNKRVILLIDEFDQMLREKRFSQELFSFLRGANNEGKIIALVTSRVHLMDESLHGDSATPDRMSLFNHFQLQFLDPFDGREALGFLEWSPAADPPLTPKEKAYIQKLGGGSPHFLQLAREEFLRRERPSGPEERENFEKKYLSRVFEDGFHDIWNRLVPAERNTLRKVADGAQPDPLVGMKLEREGYVIQTDSGPLLFSPLFHDFVKQQPRFSRSVLSPIDVSSPAPADKMPTEQIEIKIDLPYEVIPSSLYFACSNLAEVGEVTVTNHTDAPQNFEFSSELVNFTPKTENTETVPPGTHSFKLKVVLNKEELAGLTTPVTTQVRSAVVAQGDTRRPLIKSKTVNLLPSNNFLMARYDPLNQKMVDFTWLIAAWVNSEETHLQAIWERASTFDPLFDQRIPSGYKGWERMKAKVGALYKALSELSWRYDDRTLVFHKAENDYVQRVRLVSESLTDKVANCLDGAVVFASLLARSGLDPAILFTPGHAIVGWKHQKGSPSDWEFLETTGFSKISFEDACEIGQGNYRKVKAVCVTPDLNSPVEWDPEDFAILIDVRRVWIQRKIALL